MGMSSIFLKCGKEWEEGGMSGRVWVGLIKLRKEQDLSEPPSSNASAPNYE